jgi:taurine transport system ATP-binding protein
VSIASAVLHKEPVTSSPLIEVMNLSLTYHGRNNKSNVLDNINLQLYQNDFVCVLGPSGCGKSSLLNVLAGFIKPTTGEVIIDGEKHNKPNSDVGVIFQHHNLFPWLTIEKNIEFGLKMKSVPKSARKKIVSRLLKMVELESAAKMWPHQLSGGMKQRVSIARTLATDPKVILMDEPFSALDALTRENMQRHLIGIWEETQKCIFFITHDVEEALLLGTRILVMHPNPGRIVVDMLNPLRQPGKSREEIKELKEFNELRNHFISKIRSS